MFKKITPPKSAIYVGAVFTTIGVILFIVTFAAGYGVATYYKGEGWDDNEYKAQLNYIIAPVTAWKYGVKWPVFVVYGSPLLASIFVFIGGYLRKEKTVFIESE